MVMRMAKAGETVLALDGRDYALTPEMTVIAEAGEADSPGAVRAIGGIMGGEETGVTEATTEVFLEVALFDPIAIAETGRKLGIASDARYRFERGIDPTSAVWGTEIATRLILDLCGGEASEIVAAGEAPSWQRDCFLRAPRVLSLGGIDVPIAESESILTTLGFETRIDGNILHCAIPPWRPDIEGEADLVEEVLRIHGYDKIPSLDLARSGTVPKPVRDAAQQRAEFARRALAARGLVEAVTYSFMDEKSAALFGRCWASRSSWVR